MKPKLKVDDVPPPTRIESKDGAMPTKPMTLTGMVRTSKGYALATALLGTDGTLLWVRLGNSQAAKEFIAVEHKRAAVAGDLAA